MFANIPRIPLLLGLGGVVPFAVFAALIVLDVGPYAGIDWRMGMMAYAAIITSFLGGVEWGVGLLRKESEGRDTHLISSIIPPVLAWLFLLWPHDSAFLALAVLLAAQYFGDRRQLPGAGVPRWYLRLRALLVVLVSLAMASAFAALSLR